MNFHDGVESALADWPRLSEEDGHVLVPTHCLYPSNSAVTIWVGAGAGAYIVHDNRGALDELSSAGTQDRHSLLYSTFMVQHIVKSFGLSMDESGLIKAGRVDHHELLATIVLVANASKEAAIDLLKSLPAPVAAKHQSRVGGDVGSKISQSRIEERNCYRKEQQTS